ncbi:hypothetical protein [Xanthobacter flavus]|uniref:hypothetical protein n=1 Tax=Xanthobacter flavus TaxID=281 RepID=UPI0037288168
MKAFRVRAGRVATVATAAIWTVSVAGARPLDAVTEAARQWHVEMKRAAKYARIAIQTKNSQLLQENESAVATLGDQAASLTFPGDAGPICRSAAQAASYFISAGKAGSVSGYTTHLAAWDRLSDECIAAINR